MFFDTLAGIVERHLPEYVSRLEKAAIFRIESSQENAVEKSAVEWEPDQRTIENFRLPFPSLFIEMADGRTSPTDRGTLLFVEDLPSRRFGLLTGRKDRKDGSIEIAAGSIIAYPDAVDGTIPETQNQRISVMKTPMRMWVGDKARLASRPTCVNPESEVVRVGKEGWYELRTPGDREKIIQLLAEEKLDVHKLSASCAYLASCVAVMCVTLINEPATFIVEERPLVPPKDNPNLSVPRSIGRPHYIVLKPRQIRERFIYPKRPEDETEEESEARRKVGAHERRGHYRTLTAERFKHARGRVLWIDPIWVGPSEAVRGPNKYKVRLDL